MTISEYFGDWLDVFDLPQLNRTINCLNFLYSNSPVVPEYVNIFKAFTLCSKKDCRIVFLGQDPYSQKGVATGILFGNSSDTKDISPSLKVVRDSVMSLDDANSFDITLESWAKQGILMINSALTCEVNKVGKHFSLWRPFMSKFLLSLSAQKKGVVYVLFGNQAQSFEPCICKGNYILKERHPAYYARCHIKMPNKIFKEVNYYIKGNPIQWYD